VLALRGPSQIRHTLKEYEALTGFDITDRIKRFLPSKLAKGGLRPVFAAFG
jgi:hypothetical protein